MNAEPHLLDEELVARARTGDESAFEALYSRHAPALRQQIHHRLPALLRRKVAESDVIQMAYLGVHQGLQGFSDRGEGSFKAWLRKIVDHKVRDLLRRYVHTEKRSVRQEVSGPLVSEGDRAAKPGPTPSAVAVGEELKAQVLEAMRALPEDYRRVIRLVQEEGLTLSAAGERMGRSTGAAEKLYGRALARLAILIQGEGDGPGA
ncbi:MAG: RNA polymerase sigma factor [Planctomycetota bacterium]